MAASRKKAATKAKTAKPVARKAAAASAKSVVPKAAKRTARVNLGGKKPAASIAPIPNSKRVATRPANGVVQASRPAVPSIAAAPAPAAAPPPPKAKPSGLSAKDLELLRGLLVRKRAEILGNLSTMQQDTSGNDKSAGGTELSTVPLHLADLGTDHFERELTIGLVEGEKSLLRDIDDALDRVRQGTYGLCLATGEPIGKARLTAQPWAKYCYQYMLRQEGGRRFRY
ncbi:MAG: TraR/DksA C4-type zinc finger protein [Phycisphaerae bacterium]|nr:TraR/DksA C4-type zinc finger protein [Phycisphaerae bacterium]